jgi:predicted SnoaL-like aldol condensation-catalyzing enzyme
LNSGVRSAALQAGAPPHVTGTTIQLEATMTTHAVTTRKEAATAFLRLASSGRIGEAYDEYVAAEFTHHNPYFKGDAKSLRAGMEDMHSKHPRTSLDIQHALEDGDLVAVHSHVHLDPGDRGIAVVHLFRFHDDKIIELWDIGQEVPADSENENGMF